jgi:HSP20 family protein
MLTRWNDRNDFDDLFSAMTDMRSYMDQVFEEAFGTGFTNGRAMTSGSWPRVNLLDSGSSLVLTAEVPGLTEKDIELSLNQQVLTIAGQRKLEVPEGYSTHRNERASFQFSRSLSLPCRVDGDKTTATVRDGILTVTLEKAADARPRQISIQPAA